MGRRAGIHVLRVSLRSIPVDARPRRVSPLEVRETPVDSGQVSGNLPFVITYQLDPWTALGDPTRRAIFERIADHPRAVVEIARDLPVSRPAISQHLRVLKDAGLVMDHPIGTRRVYSLNPAGLSALRADLERFWSGALTSYKWIVEHTDEEEG